MTEFELVIVGAGPAGLSAAIAAARHGAEVLLIDENARPGGQIYRALPPTFQVRDAAALGKDFRDGRALMEAFEAVAPRVTTWTDTLVWGLFPGRELAVLRAGKAVRLTAGALILAPGAYDRPVPFPGWTLPGVMALGGLQRLVKTDRVLPARRVLLSGTGPLLWVVAVQLLQAGVEVAAVLDSASYRAGWRHLPRLLSQWRLMGEGLGYLRTLRRAGVPLLQRHAILAARGSEGVEEAVFGPVDAQGRPIPGRQRTLAVDAIGVGFGFIPSVQLSRLSGCDHRYEGAVGGWVPVRDRCMETSVAGVFVAGDGAGVAGALPAQTEGRLAALGACRALGRLTPEAAAALARPLQAELRRMQRFRRAVDALFAVGEGIYERIDDATVVCRCEEVRAGEIRRLIAEGVQDVNELKRLGRPGMGPCQGRMCEPALNALLVQATGRAPEHCGALRVRPPIKPVPLGMASP